MQVLVVDDDEAGRYLVCSIVRSAGHEAIEAENGVQALEVARQAHPDLLITDILMPVMDGYQLAREWKTDEILGKIPLIFLTASYTDPADRKFAGELGADAFLSKPVDPNLLLETIERVTQISSTQHTRRPTQRTEVEVLKDYSDRVGHKLEQKLEDLERANSMLENTMGTLAEEVEVKRALIEELSREHDLNRSIVETADVFIVRTDTEARITLFSPGAERMSGYRAEEVLGRDYIDLFCPSDERDRRRELHRALLASRGRQRITNSWTMQSGSERVFEWSATVVKDDADEPSAVIHFGIDATDRAVADALEHVSGVIDSAVLLDHPVSGVLELAAAQTADEFSLGAVWIGLLDDEGGLDIVAASGRIAPILGDAFNDDPALACPVADLAALHEAVAFSEAENGLPPQWTALAGDIGIHSACVLPIRAHGGVLGLVGSIAYSAHAFDTNRLAALQAIADRLGVAIVLAGTREQVVLQSAALESAANAIVIADLSGRILWANPAFENVTGYPVDEVTGTELFARGPGYREHAYEHAWTYVQKGSSWSGELKNAKHDGTEYYESVTIAPVRDDAGTVTHGVISKQDVSERVRLEELKGDFVAMVSHELRTPLTTIIGYADLLAAGAGKLDEDKLVAATASIRTSGMRMKSIVEQLLEVTQIQAEGVKIETVQLDIGRLVKEIASGVPMSEHHVLHFDIPDNMPQVEVDTRRIAHAVRNLVDNAVKYSPKGGSITVSVHDVGSEIVIAISDEGVGMPEDQIPQLFQAFQQCDMTSTRSFGGIGVGLFVAYQFVAAHGGRITVRSREGHGSTFEIRLPVGPSALSDSSGAAQSHEDVDLDVVG